MSRFVGNTKDKFSCDEAHMKWCIRAFKPKFYATLSISFECLPQSENQIMALVCVRSITHSTKYQKAPFC